MNALFKFCRAVCTCRHKVVSLILNMHQGDYDYTAKLLFETDPISPVNLQAAPVFTAANIGNRQVFEALIIHSKIPLNTILRRKQEYEFSRPDGTTKHHVETPLSLILSKPQNYSLIDTLADFDKLDKCNHLTSIDLSHTRTSTLPVELFKLRNLYRINISNNKLSTLSVLRLPQNCWPNLLRDLNISYNSIEQIPLELFQLPCLETLNVSHNNLKALPVQWWATKSISMLDISFNVELTGLSLEDGGEDIPSSPRMLKSSPRMHPIHGEVSRKLSNYCIACRISNSLLKNLNASHCSFNEFPSFLALFFQTWRN